MCWGKFEGFGFKQVQLELSTELQAIKDMCLKQIEPRSKPFILHNLIANSMNQSLPEIDYDEGVTEEMCGGVYIQYMFVDTRLLNFCKSFRELIPSVAAAREYATTIMRKPGYILVSLRGVSK